MPSSETTTTAAPRVTTPIPIEEFEFGESPEELLITLKKHDMELIANEHHQSDGRLLQADYSFWYETEDASFGYTPEGVHYRTVFFTPRMRTSLGVGVGNTFDEVVAAHGTDYEEKIFSGLNYIGMPYRNMVVTYFYEDFRLSFRFEDEDIVTTWNLSTRSMFDSEYS